MGGGRLFDDSLLPAVEIDVDHPPGDEERLIGESKCGGFVVEVLADAEAVGRFIEFEIEAGAFIGDDREGGVAVSATRHHQMAGEGEHPSDLGQGIVRDQLGRDPNPNPPPG